MPAIFRQQLVSPMTPAPVPSPPPPPPAVPTIVLSSTGNATVGQQYPVNVTASNVSEPWSISVVRESGVSATISPSSVLPEPGSLTKIAYATAAAVGTLSLRANGTYQGQNYQSNLLNVNVVAAPVPTPPPPPPPPPAPAPAPSPASPYTGLRESAAVLMGEDAALIARSTGGVTDAPFAANMAFARGQFPQSEGVAFTGLGTDYQVSVLSTWDDNSVKIATVAGRASVPAGGKLYFSAQRGTAPTGTALTESDLAASGVTASMQFAGGTTMTLSSLIGVTAVSDATGLVTNGRVRQIVSGNKMSSWLYAARLSATDIHLVGWMEVRLYADGSVHILPWVSNGWLRLAGCTGHVGTLSFVMNGTTRYSENEIHIANHCRAYAQSSDIGHWSGSVPDLWVVEDHEYLQTTGLVPPYDRRDTTSATRLDSISQNYSPTLYGQTLNAPRDSGGNGLNNGDFDAGMSNAGYHAGIGLLPEWDAFWMTSGDRRAYNSVVANAMGYGRYGVHWLDELTLVPPNPTDLPNVTLSQTTVPLYGSASSRNTYGLNDVGANQFGGVNVMPPASGYEMPDGRFILPEAWAMTHHPSAGALAYILTGWYAFLDLSQSVASVCYLRQNNLHREYGLGIQYTQRETVRGAAWALRSIFQAAALSLDGTALKNGFTTILNNNIDYYYGAYVETQCPSFGAVRPYSNFNGNVNIPQYRVNAWELDFFWGAIGYGLLMRPVTGSSFTKLTDFFHWGAQWVTHRLGALGDANSYGFNSAARNNSICIAPSQNTSPWDNGNQGPWYSTPGEAFIDTIGARVAFRSSTVSAASGSVVVTGTGSGRDLKINVSGISGAGAVVRLETSTDNTTWSATTTTFTSNVNSSIFNDALTEQRYYRLVLEANAGGGNVWANCTVVSRTNEFNTTNTIGAFDSNNGGFPEATGYWGNFQYALSMAVLHGAAGAWDGYLRMVRASNWSSFDPGLVNYPVASVRAPNSPPAWSGDIAPNSFSYFNGTQFKSWGVANITGGPFRGTAPIDSIVNSYNDPAYDPITKKWYFYGGGHGDGSCNAVVECDPISNFSYRVASPATPASVYLPQYMTTTSPISYPSGVPFFHSPSATGFFRTLEDGLDPVLDAQYAAPQSARIITHMYAAAAYRKGKVHYFYLTYGEVDVRTGKWTGQGVNINNQLQAIFSNYGNTSISPSIRAIYDEVTDKFFVTMPHEGWRNGIYVFDPKTRQVTSVHDSTFGNLLEDTPIVKIGRKLYGFRRVQPSGYSGPQNLNQGFIVDMDQMAAATGRVQMQGQAFTVVGETDGGIYPYSTTQDTIPCYWDGKAIRRWNYSVAHRQYIYSVNIVPESGSGTVADPYVFRQTRQTIAGTLPSTPMYIYSRFIYDEAARAAICIPRADSDWFAVRFQEPTTFFSGNSTDTGTLVGDTWTPSRDGFGIVTQASWDSVPTNRWIEVVDTEITRLTPTIASANIGWDTSAKLWGVASGGSNIFQSWSGFTVDQNGGRFWFFGGGHSDGDNNGLYRFDCRKMSWAVECLPSNRLLWSTEYSTNGTSTYHPESMATAVANFNANNPAGTTVGVTVPVTNGPMYDEIPDDKKPTARHTYNSMAYTSDVGLNGSIFMHCRRLWRYDIALGKWVMRRLFNDQIKGNIAAPNATSVIETHAAEFAVGLWDESTRRILCSASGSSGAGSAAFNWDTQSWQSWGGAYSLNYNHAAIERVGRTVVSFQVPTSSATQPSDIQAGRVWVHNMDTGATTMYQIQLSGGLTYANFVSSATYYDAYAMVYVPPLNKYWIFTRSSTGADMQTLELDMTVNPPTLSPLTFTNASPIVRRLAQGRVKWIEKLNAVIAFDNSYSRMSVYKF